jgi:aspartate 1-decarboxylase
MEYLRGEKMITMLKSKIHHAKVTETNLGYIGSLFIDEDLLEKANIKKFEKIEVFNLNNGKNWTTYAMPAERGSGIISVRGSASHHCKQGDMINILVYAITDKEEYPKMILLDKDNHFEKYL